MQSVNNEIGVRSTCHFVAVDKAVHTFTDAGVEAYKYRCYFLSMLLARDCIVHGGGDRAEQLLLIGKSVAAMPDADLPELTEVLGNGLDVVEASEAFRDHRDCRESRNQEPKKSLNPL